MRMKKQVVSVLKALAYGGLAGAFVSILVLVLGLQITNTQGMIMTIALLIGTSVIFSITKAFILNKPASWAEWGFLYGTHRIKVKTGLIDRLYINDALADVHKGIALRQVVLSGSLPTGETVQATIKGGWSLTCQLLVAGQVVEHSILDKN